VADLTNLESKLGEVTGLAMAAKAATTTVSKLARAEHKELVPALKQMKDEAAETEKRCKALAGSFTGKKTAILEEAKETQDKASRMLEIYLDDSSDALDGFEFLTMAEAGEVGHWEVLQQMSRTAGNAEVKQLVAWALPIQKRHFDTARKTSAQLAASEDPHEEE
jgi:dihydroorotase-like cyclic amidohydrolase